MRTAFIISLAVHIFLGFASMRLVRIRQVKFVPREIYAVKLVSLQEAGGEQKAEMKGPPKPAPQAPPPEKLEEKKPDELVAPVKQTKSKKKEVTQKTVPSSLIEKRNSVPSAQADSTAGGGGGVATGDMSLDVADFPFVYYLATIKRKIAANWQVPATAGQSISCRVYFRISRLGSIDSPAVENSSGNFMFDQAALRAVLEANPLPPLPGGFGDGYLGVHFSFAYEEE